jgi:hypothetical protein
MHQLALVCGNTPFTGICGLCGGRTDLPAGHRLCVAGNLHPVCPDCGHQHASSLAALVLLAGAAQRVSRIGRHSVFPPLSVLLDLAGAAEEYTRTVDAAPPQAG